MIRRTAIFNLICVVSLFISIGCASQSISTTSPASTSVEGPLSQYKGDVLVLLMGTEGCGNTEKATRFLGEYSKTVPETVSVARYDVPPPGRSIPGVIDWKHGYHYGVDEGRKIASALSFFYYPTLYILDRDGEVRYCGTCDEDRVPEIVNALVEEKAGAEKKLFSPMMLGKGEKAPDFQAGSLEGGIVNLSELLGEKATLLVFGSTTCPFARNAANQLAAVRSEFRSKGLSLVIVNEGQYANATKSFYDKAAPGIPVLRDDDSAIGKNKFGILGVPFFYLLDGKGLVRERMPFTADAAREAVAALLERRESRAREKASRGGG